MPRKPRIKQEIIDKIYPTYLRLLSKKDTADELGINVNTVSHHLGCFGINIGKVREFKKRRDKNNLTKL